MDREQIAAQLREILSLVLRTELPTGEVEQGQIEAWDSLRHVELIFAVEEAFDIQLSQDDMANALSLRAFVDIVDGRLAP